MAGIDDVLERLVGDAEFRVALAANPAQALAGYQLTRADLELLAGQFDDDASAERSVEQRTSKSAMMSLLGALDGMGGGKGGGAADDHDHKGWIDLLSVGQSAHKSGDGDGDASIGVGELQEMSISKEIDKATPMLSSDPGGGAGGPGGGDGQPDIIVGSGPGGGPRAAEDFYLKIDTIEGESEAQAVDPFIKIEGVDGDSERSAGYVKFEGVEGESESRAAYVKFDGVDGESKDSASMSGDADDRPTEEVALNYNKITHEYNETSVADLSDAEQKAGRGGADSFFDID